MKLHVIGAVVAALLAPALLAADKEKTPSVLLPVGYVKASAPSCGCGLPAGPNCAAPATCAAPAGPTCAAKPTRTACAPAPRRSSPCVTKPSCTTCVGGGYQSCENTCQIFGGPCCGSLVPSFPKWCSYFGRGVDSLLPCGRSCGRAVVCNNPEVCDEVCGCGSCYNSWGGCGCPRRGCGDLPPPGYCRQRNAFALWPQMQCCPDLACGLTGCNTGACGACRTGGCSGGCGGGGLGLFRRGCCTCSCDTSATSGNGHVVTYPHPSEAHAAPEMPNLRHHQQPTPAPEPAAPKAAPRMKIPPPVEVPPEMPDPPLPEKKEDPFGDDDNLPPLGRDALHLAPPARLPGRPAGSTKPTPAPRMKTAQLEPVNLGIVPAVHVDEDAVKNIKSRPVTGPRLAAPSRVAMDVNNERPSNPLRK